jgi:hypothetical protein
MHTKRSVVFSYSITPDIISLLKVRMSLQESEVTVRTLLNIDSRLAKRQDLPRENKSFQLRKRVHRRVQLPHFLFRSGTRDILKFHGQGQN